MKKSQHYYSLVLMLILILGMIQVEAQAYVDQSRTKITWGESIYNYLTGSESTEPSSTTTPLPSGSTSPTDQKGAFNPTVLPGTPDNTQTPNSESTTKTPGSDDTTQTPETQTPKTEEEKAAPNKHCTDDSSTFNKEDFNAFLTDNTLPTGKTDADQYFKEQWCAFQNAPTDKWEGITGKPKFMEKLGTLYDGIDLTGFEPETWGENNEITIGKTKMNLNLDNYYADENEETDFSFQGNDDYKYERKPIKKMTYNKETDSMEITFGEDSEDKGTSKLTLKGEDVTFDPKTMEITRGEKKYGWNGQGDLNFDAEGNLELQFQEGTDANDITNFPIVNMPDGNQISPYQTAVEGVEAPKDTKKPATGKYTTFEKDGKKYTMDSSGKVREIKNPKVKIKDNKIASVENAYVNLQDKEGVDQGELYVQGNVGFGKENAKKDGSYFDLDDEGNLKINIAKDEKVYYKLKQNLESLEVTGEGKGYVRNGNGIVTFEDGKIDIRDVPQEFQTEESKKAYAIKKIPNAKDPKKPFTMKENDDGKVEIVDSSGEEVDLEEINKPEPEVEEPVEVEKPTTGEKFNINFKLPETKTPETYTIRNTLKGTFEKGLTKSEFMNNLLSKGELVTDIHLIGDPFWGAPKFKVITGLKGQGLTTEMQNYIDNKYGPLMTGETLRLQLSQGRVYLNGQPMTQTDSISYVKNKILSIQDNLYSQYSRRL